MSKFIATKVKCNGTGGAGYQGALKHKDTIFKIVEEVRSSMSPESFWQLVQLQNQRKHILLSSMPVGDIIAMTILHIGSFQDWLGIVTLI